MHVQFIKNVQFTKLLKIEGRMREFNFRKPNGRESGLFTVDVSDDRGYRIIFTMSKEETNWKIMPAKLPVWITDNELMLDEIIQEEMKSV
jgi:hypothetical protein